MFRPYRSSPEKQISARNNEAHSKSKVEVGSLETIEFLRQGKRTRRLLKQHPEPVEEIVPSSRPSP